MTERLQCDLVMRGGITSGMVYPRAIAKLAETHDFRSIGGTSAGAIAAAATAAAALGSKSGQDHFQTRIKALPEELAKRPHKDDKTVLERLFQPQPSTRRLFQVLMASLGREHRFVKATRVCWTLCAAYWLLALAGAAVSLVPLLAVVLAFGFTGWALLALIAGILPTVALALLAASVGAVFDIFRRLPKNRYGLCSGSSDGLLDSAGVLPLTDWLHELFQSLANHSLDKPVTFGDLWNTKGNEEAERDIELVLMTTNITRGVSHRLPFLEGSWGQLFFKEEDFAQLFPASIVKWLKAKARKPGHKEEVKVPKGYYGLPKPADLPILLGVRMSLSFPFLLSAVPLYAANFERKTSDGKFLLQCCWFSDGGLTSNFPIHFFDTPLPSRPTFAINLVPDTVDATEIDVVKGKLRRVSGLGASEKRSGKQVEGWDKVWMPSKNATGIASVARFNTFTDAGGFFSAMFDTARNWADTELMAMPGYRDRIVHVKLAPN
jgi:predicted acylesterase/phospholipase RssA